MTALPTRDIAEVAREVLAAHPKTPHAAKHYLWDPDSTRAQRDAAHDGAPALARFVLALVEPDDALVERVAILLYELCGGVPGRWGLIEGTWKNAWLSDARDVFAALRGTP